MQHFSGATHVLSRQTRSRKVGIGVRRWINFCVNEEAVTAFAKITLERPRTGSKHTVHVEIREGSICVGPEFTEMYRQGWVPVASSPAALLDGNPCDIVAVFRTPEGHEETVHARFDGQMIRTNLEIHQKVTRHGWKFLRSVPLSFRLKSDYE